jgi:hypothetical protein
LTRGEGSSTKVLQDNSLEEIVDGIVQIYARFEGDVDVDLL